MLQKFQILHFDISNESKYLAKYFIQIQGKISNINKCELTIWHMYIQGHLSNVVKYSLNYSNCFIVSNVNSKNSNVSIASQTLRYQVLTGLRGNLEYKFLFETETETRILIKVKYDLRISNGNLMILYIALFFLLV